MSKLFFDHLVSLEEIEVVVKNSVSSREEAEELEKLVDELVHHRVLGCVLDKLPRQHHEEFLDLFHQSPHDEKIFDYLERRIGKSIEEEISKEVKLLEKELLSELKPNKENPKF